MKSTTPKGLRISAQGCAPRALRATLGSGPQTPPNPEGVASRCFNCNGTGKICNLCGEAEGVCDCITDVPEFASCQDCKGSGK